MDNLYVNSSGQILSPQNQDSDTMEMERRRRRSRRYYRQDSNFHFAQDSSVLKPITFQVIKL